MLRNTVSILQLQTLPGRREPMNQTTDRPQQLNRIRDLTGFDLRDDYTELLHRYPAELLHATRADDGSDAEGLVSTVELMSDLTDVLDVNEEVRQGSVPDPQGEEFYWPNQVLVIGENGEGDYYGIDLANEYPGVLFFDHQTVEFEELTDSLSEYVEMLRESFPA